ncbi:MAG: NADH:ubiquinone reductase (Na(+)-transporting) subunit C [Muribaculaceae bacterium]
MNKQSNVYTVIYIIIMVVVVGVALAYTSMSLKPLQNDNVAADKMRQIISSLRIPPEEDVKAQFVEVITDQYLVNAQGQRIDGDAFAVNMANEVKKPAAERQLPVYEARLADGSKKYIIPIYGAGLWGPIWGYVALDDDASTIYGAFFNHEGETPGLGAEITKKEFSSQFQGKEMFKNGELVPVAVVKAGQTPSNGADYVDGISGGTITSKGVSAMLADCFEPYNAFLQSLRNK